MAFNAATASWIKRAVSGFVRGELPGPLRFLMPEEPTKPIETTGIEAPAPAAPEAEQTTEPPTGTEG